MGEDIFGELVNSKNLEQLKGDDGVRSLVHAFQEGKILNSVGDPIYFNIALIKQLKLK